jgi:hypothetical protein
MRTRAPASALTFNVSPNGIDAEVDFLAYRVEIPAERMTERCHSNFLEELSIL